jgi:hypothetical protein|tara:strand:- start:142 stop:564 length:423 start_codon:yes stop_codon:yes gene_type:complete
MRLINYYKLALVFLIVFSCTDTNEETNQNFSINIKNQSLNTLTFEGWKESEMIYEEIILNNSFYRTNYSSVNFLGLFGNIDSLVIKFENNKGYLCTGELSDNLCFQNKNAFDIEDFVSLGNNAFEFEINQDDFDNANDLQ